MGTIYKETEAMLLEFEIIKNEIKKLYYITLDVFIFIIND